MVAPCPQPVGVLGQTHRRRYPDSQINTEQRAQKGRTEMGRTRDEQRVRIRSPKRKDNRESDTKKEIGEYIGG